MRIPVRRVLGACLMWATLLGCGSVQGQLSSYVSTNAFPNLSFSSPVCIASPPGETNRIFVIEQNGVIVVITNLANPTRTVFINLTDRVIGSGEQGLLGLAFHPNYASNRRFFVFYTGRTNSDSGPHDILSRFETSMSNPNQGDTNSEVRLISQPDEAANHNGGDIHFGADGYLYVSLGDEGGSDDTYNNSQRIDKDFFSGILRIDVDKRPNSLTPHPHPASSSNYAIPPDNPFVGDNSFNGSAVMASNVRTEFWAVGLRNPWRWSFDPETGHLYCADVGQGQREEIDIITKGGNYQWAYKEGTVNGQHQPPANPTNPKPPIFEYDHNTGNCIIGGVVYRGSRFPDLVGYYIYADFGSGKVWVLKSDGVSVTVPPQQLFTDGGISAFGTDPRNGDILYASLNDSMVKRVVRAVPSGSLRVTLQPQGAINDGARWRVDGGAFRTSGTTVDGLAVGDHTVNYKSIAGWTAPADQTVTVDADSTANTNGTYVAIDSTKPTCVITSPDTNERVTNAVITVTGTAKDNVAVASVFYQMNDSDWAVAASADGFTNWTAADLPLTPGTNVVRAYTVDSSGNISATNRVTFAYVLTSQLRVFINGNGSVQPNLDSSMLEIGRRYTMTAKPGKNYAFFAWGGDLHTNKPTLTFTMQPDMLLSANFRDARRPTLIITSPANNRRVTNAVVNITGKANDNVGVQGVMVTLNRNGSSFLSAPGIVTSTNGFTNWVATALANAGPNVVEASAYDDAGNMSLTVKTKFTFAPGLSADWAPDNLSGLIGVVSPDSDGSSTNAFDAFTFTRTGSSDDDFVVGNYDYTKTGTNSAHLTMRTAGPLSRTNQPPLDLTLEFTNQYQGTFTSDESEGAINFALVPPRVSSSMAGKKLTLRSDNGTDTTTVSLSNKGTFTQKPSLDRTGLSSAGTFLSWRFSPIGDFVALAFKGADDGNITELQLTFTSKTSGLYQITTWTGPGTVIGTDAGTFTMQ
jgi:glucose/arabinose dehydrogenase